MYYFPDFDEDTRLVMLNELEQDIKNRMFYEPVSMTSNALCFYKNYLKETFSKYDLTYLINKLERSCFKTYTKNGRKVPKDIATIIAFNDFNRYYIRAIIVRAIRENRSLMFYRAKKSLNKRSESKKIENEVIYSEQTKKAMLDFFRDYKKLFNSQNTYCLLKPNSGLSLRFAP